MLGFLLIPLYTRYLNTAEYGALALLTLLIQGINYLCLMGINTATTRLYFLPTADDAYQRKLFSHASLLLLVVPAVVLIPAVPIIGAVINLPFRSLVLPVLLMGLFTPMIQLMNSLLTIQHRPLPYTAFHLSYFFFQSVAIIVAVASLGLGLVGQVLAQATTSALFAGVALMIIMRYTPPKYVRGLTRPLLMFGIPMLPSFLCVWVDAGAGRFGLEHYASLDELGIYLLSSQFAGIVALVGSSLENAVMPEFLRRAQQNNSEGQLGLLVTRLIGLFVLAGVGLMLFAPTAIVVMSTPPYYAAIEYVAPLTVAAVLYAIRMPVNWSLTHSNQPGLLSAINTLSTALLVVSLVLALGHFGMSIRGVAYASIGVNLVALLIGTTAAQLRYRLHLSLTRLAVMGLILIGCWAVAPGNPDSALDPWFLTGRCMILGTLALLIGRTVGIINPLHLLRELRGR